MKKIRGKKERGGGPGGRGEKKRGKS